jgi:hypothetical protein
MDDRQVGAGRRRIPTGLLGALVLIFAVERAIVSHRMGTLGGSQWGYELARAEADAGGRDCQVLCFGDSLLKQGLAPTVVESKSGLKTYNFALPGGQAPGNYFLLRRALDSGARPSAIVVENLPRLMATDPDFNLENWPFLASPAECLELARISGNPKLGTGLLLRDLIPSYRCRSSIRVNLKTALDGGFDVYAREVQSALRNWEVNRGAEILPSRPGRVEDVDTWMRGYFPDFSCSATNRAYIEKFLDLAASRQIPVFWVLPPYKPELQARCEQAGIDALHESFVRGLQAKHPGLRVIDARHAGYDAAVFSDLHHLGREGAALFSTEVAEVLRRHHADPESTSRWLALADFRSAPVAGPIEDMDQSRRKVFEIATQAAAGLRR